jgi:hypothetical protein
MGVGADIEIEEIEDVDLPYLDGKGLADIIVSIIVQEETYTKKLSKKYNFDIKPFIVSQKDEDTSESPWQNAIDLWNAAFGLYQAIEKEGQNIFSQSDDYLLLRDNNDLEYIKEELKLLI